MPLRTLETAAVLLAVLMLTTGCMLDRTPPPPPFRVAEYGAGLEISNPGRLVRIHAQDDDQALQGRLRVSAHSMRLQSANAIPRGSIRPTPQGFSFRTRDGHVLCTLSQEAHRVECDDHETWVALPDDQRLLISHGHTPAHVLELSEENLSIETAGKKWSPYATTLIYHAYAQPVDDIRTFAAYTLLAWSLRWQDDDHNREGEH